MWQHFLLSLSTFYRNCALGFQPVKKAQNLTGITSIGRSEKCLQQRFAPVLWWVISGCTTKPQFSAQTPLELVEFRLHQFAAEGPCVLKIHGAGDRRSLMVCMVSHEVKGCFSESCSRQFHSWYLSKSGEYPSQRQVVSTIFHYFPLTIPWAWCTRHYRFKMIISSQSLRLVLDSVWSCISRIQTLKLPSSFPPEVQWSKHLKTQTITFKHVEILWNFHDISMDFIEDLVFLDPPKRIKKEPGGTWNRSSDPPWLLSQ